MVVATSQCPSSHPGGLLHQAGTSSAVWAIGSNAICKVKTWTDGMEMESSTLAFVKANFPNIPVPDVIYAWLDEKLSRTFLILKRVQGNTLAQAWPSLTPEMRDRIATTVAHNRAWSSGAFSERMCQRLSPVTETPIIRADVFVFPSKNICKGYQNFTNRLLLLHSTSTTRTLDITNLLISEDGMINTILDWESAGFYPKYWVTLKPYMSLGFCLPVADDRYAWADLLIAKLRDKGFVLDMACVEWYKNLDLGFFDTDMFLDK